MYYVILNNSTNDAKVIPSNVVSLYLSKGYHIEHASNTQTAANNYLTTMIANNNNNQNNNNGSTSTTNINPIQANNDNYLLYGGIAVLAYFLFFNK